jgi:hypothetical protein
MHRSPFFIPKESMMIDLTSAELKAESLQYTVGLIARFERIVGTEVIRQLERTGEANIGIGMKRRLMIEIFGYTTEEADEASVALLEAELSFFFLTWEWHCKAGRLRSGRSHLSGIISQLANPETASTPPNSCPTDTRSNSTSSPHANRSRKGKRSRR